MPTVYVIGLQCANEARLTRHADLQSDLQHLDNYFVVMRFPPSSYMLVASLDHAVSQGTSITIMSVMLRLELLLLDFRS